MISALMAYGSYRGRVSKVTRRLRHRHTLALPIESAARAGLDVTLQTGYLCAALFFRPAIESIVAVEDGGNLMRPIGGFAASLILLALAAAAHGQTAERPVWQVGDKWSFKESTRPPPEESVWTREVAEALPDGRFRVRMQNGGTLTFDGETNSLDARGPEYTWKRFSFPLTVGKKWTHNRQIGTPPHNGYEHASWELKAYETLTVPAGTFDCFRVYGAVSQGISYTLYGQGSSFQYVTYWYCPVVKWIARMRSRSEGGVANLDSESVLTSFVAGQ